MSGPVGAYAVTADGLIAAGPRVYYGTHVDAGAAAQVEIRDGGAAGKLLWSSRLAAAGTDDHKDVPKEGIATKDGIWVEVVSGTPTVTVYAA
jgi:hypothetical protein